jgi:hypothetical protein
MSGDSIDFLLVFLLSATYMSPGALLARGRLIHQP